MAFPTLDDDTIEAKIRRLINEPSPLVFSSSEIDGFIWEALNEVAEKSLCNFAVSATLQLATDTREYTYATAGILGCVKVDAIIYHGASATTTTAATHALIKIHPRQYQHLISGGATAGAPKYFCEIDGKINIWPEPAAAQNGHYCLIFYRKVESTNDGDDVVNLPDYLQEYVIFYVLARCLEADRKFAQAEQYMSIFNLFINFHKAEKYILPADSKEMMGIQDRTQFVE